MNEVDKKVLEYLERAKKIYLKINLPRSMDNEFLEIIEIAKLIQTQENK